MASKRRKVKPRKSRKIFSQTADRTKAVNNAPPPMRGGFRI